jgi:hypothetical protein
VDVVSTTVDDAITVVVVAVGSVLGATVVVGSWASGDCRVVGLACNVVVGASSALARPVRVRTVVKRTRMSNRIPYPQRAWERTTLVTIRLADRPALRISLLSADIETGERGRTRRKAPPERTSDGNRPS